jgi:4-hydroxymandelate oxidase
VQDLFDLEAIARTRMDTNAWEYINSAAADEITMRWNREAFDRQKLNPHVLRDVSAVDTATTVLGKPLKFPVILAPTALHKLAHPEGEIATAHGATAGEATMVLSTLSSTTVEDVAHAIKQPLWFQLYVQKDKGFTKELVQRAAASGCQALVVTVDTPTDGARNRQYRAKFHLPAGVEMANLRGMPTPWKSAISAEHQVFENLLPDRLTWKDIEWLQSLSSLPVLLKGVLNSDDADLAARSGCAGIIVSNHGARNLDTVPPTIEALPRVTYKVASRIAVLMDGGVRRGTDVVKAIALGANAVLIGRPVFYALSAGGAQGVTRALMILRRELEMAMALLGVKNIREIDRGVLWS